MTLIYHITTRGAWGAAASRDSYEDPSLSTEGFIHCSTGSQIGGVLERYFAGKKDLLILVIDPVKLESKLVFEYSELLHENFPHVFGPIGKAAVIDLIRL